LKKNQRIVLAHSGKQHVYHVAKALKKLELLHSFHTSGYISSDIIQKLVKIFDIGFLKKRFEEGLYGNQIHSNWQFEFPEFWSRYIQKKDENYLTSLMIDRDVNFGNYMSQKIKQMDYDVFWGYNGSCLEALKSTNLMGKLSICETQLAYIPFTKKILTEEAKLHPEWADSIDFHNLPSAYEKRLIEEPIVAKKVIAISSFLKKTLEEGGVEAEKIDVLPLGCEISKVRYNFNKHLGIKNRPLKVLYAGRVTQRKGIKYAFDAIKTFNKKDVEFHIIGLLHGSGEAFRTNSKYCNYIGKVSQAELFEKYTDYDVLLFPSLSEGFGLVALEAMGAGVPVIATPHTNAFELIDHEKNGFLVPIRDVGAICEALSFLRNMDENAYLEMSLKARERALEYTWDTFQLKLSTVLHTWKLL
jgi:alpha-maltose-1-phosphate synthase